MFDKKIWIYVLLVLCFFCVVFVGGRGAYSALKTVLFSSGSKEVLRDLAYDVNPKRGYTVYLKEGNTYVPYLVVSSNYGDNVLLLRRELLKDTMPYNENERHMWASHEYGGYYENSSIDRYLNSEFINRFSQTVQDEIVYSKITITDKSSLGVTGNKTTEISRKVFLLSLKELNGAESYASVSEGSTIKFFADNYNRRSAYLPNGEKSAYWTRTPETWETYNVFTIGHKATGAGSADIDSGVRPAFSLSKSTSIKQRLDIVTEQAVYVIE